MSALRHVTYNLLDFGHGADRDRVTLVRETIKATDGDVFSVQEIHGSNGTERLAVFSQLAADLGLECRAVDAATGTPRPVFDAGHGNRGVGVMWRPDRVQPLPDTLRIYDRAGLSVGMALVKLRIDNTVTITIASTHWRPRFPRSRADEGVYVAREVTAMGAHGIVGADWNNVYASPGVHGEYYDQDPYAKQPWHPSNIGKARPNNETGTGIARREAMAEMQDGGLVDPAAFIGAAWYRTVGHWNDDEVDKRIDGPMVTPSIATATQTITAFDDAPAHHASDHLPVMLTVDVDALADS